MTHTNLIQIVTLREGLRLLGTLEGESPDGLYILEDEESGALYGLKFLPRPGAYSVVEELAEYARGASKFSHPNLATTHTLGFVGEQPYVIREFVPGEPLASLARRDALPLRGLFNVAYQSAKALSAAHGAGVTHQDIGPEKIIITQGHDVKLVDFGVGRYKRLTSFLAGPRADVDIREFLREEREAAAAGDLSSLGRALYFAATGQPPPAGEDASIFPALIARHRRERRQLPPTLWLAPWKVELLSRAVDRLVAPETREGPDAYALLREMRPTRNEPTKFFMDYDVRALRERARGESAGDDPEPVPVRSGREVNAWIVDGGLPLIRDRRYRVGVNIGAPREGRLAGWPFAEPDWGDRSEIRLLLSLHAAGVDVSPSCRRARLHREKNMRAVYFDIIPRVAGPVSLHISIFLARELTLLEEFRVGVVVADKAEVEQAA